MLLAFKREATNPHALYKFCLSLGYGRKGNTQTILFAMVLMIDISVISPKPSSLMDSFQISIIHIQLASTCIEVCYNL